jgi:uracil-DNA glycosylase
MSSHTLAESRLAQLAEDAAHCRRCPLYRNATQAVFGEGPLHAPLLMVGEQPGDQEDKEGHPFVGPAGRIFDRALKIAGLDRRSIYVTNAVKHFKHE